MSKEDEQREAFLKYLSYIEIDGVEYVRSDEDLLDMENRKTFDDLNVKQMYVTWGDDKPWLQVVATGDYSFALEPELALYWLDKIVEFYQKKNNSLSETIIKEKEE